MMTTTPTTIRTVTCRRSGRVKSYRGRTNQGFIQPTDGISKKDIAVHARNIVNDGYLYAGDIVEFDVVERSQGESAVNVYVRK